MRSVHFRALPSLLLLIAACGDDAPAPMRRPDAGRDAGDTPDLSVDFGVDLGSDAGPCAPLAACGGACVDTTSSVEHCGACGTPCTPPADAIAACVASACTFTCLPGFARDGEACVPAPRLVSPSSGATATTRRPSLRFALPTGTASARLEVCAERSCATPLVTLDVSGDVTVPAEDLPSGLVHWRVVAGSAASRVWALWVPPRSAPVDAAWGVTPDYDGEGSGDVVVGAPAAGSGDGRAYVYAGSASGTPVAPTRILRALDGSAGAFATSLACAGDVNGDGFPDLVVGAPDTEAQKGLVSLYFGGPEGLRDAPDQTLNSPRPAGGLFGRHVAAAGDVDRDGYGDVLVVAPAADSTPGRVFVYRGGPRGVEAMPATQLSGVGRFGSAVAGAMDLDADGFADVAVGAVATASEAGAIHVFRGGAAGLTTTASIVLAPTTGPGSQLGAAVASAGDLDGDGYADLAGGAPNAPSNDAPDPDAGTVRAPGRVVVWRGGPAGIGGEILYELLPGTGTGSLFGAALAASDLTGDGYSDLVVGAFGTSRRQGRLYVFAGGDTPSRIPTLQLDGPAANSDFGRALAIAGDADRSGLADLVVGAPRTDADTGRAFVFRGNAAGLSLTPLAELVAPSGGSFGLALARGDR
jgi:hypothetical protein